MSNEPINIKRLGLVISPNSHPGAGLNICGPCCIEVPEWVTSRFGAYYLYFADHAGDHIKMAYADDIEGPWLIVKGGVLSLDGFFDAYDHIASPEIFIDHINHRIRMYFHARAHSLGREQWTFSAISEDGVNFKPEIDRPLAPFYLRVFEFQNRIFGISKGGNMWMSRNGTSPFEAIGNIFDESLSGDLWHNFSGAARHFGIKLKSNLLGVYFSRIGDNPERILFGEIDLTSPNWTKWKCSDLIEVIRPEKPYEGCDLPVRHSVSGASDNRENALRDPYVLSISKGDYLFYTVAGEKGIAVCKLST